MTISRMTRSGWIAPSTTSATFGTCPERLSLLEAKAISRRLRQARQEITNASVLTEIRDRTSFIADLLMAKSASPTPFTPTAPSSSAIASPSINAPTSDVDEEEDEYFDPPAKRVAVPPVRVFDYDKLRHEHAVPSTREVKSL